MIRIAGAISGAETYNFNLVRGFKKIFPEEKITYITNNTDFAKRLRELKVKVKLLKIPLEEIGTKKNFLKAFIILPYYLFIFIRVLTSLSLPKKDSVIFFQSMTEKIFLTVPLKILGYNVGWIEHGPLFITQRALIIKQLYKVMSTFVDRIIVVSQDTLKDLETSGVPSQKLQLIRTGVDTSFFAPFTDEEISKQKEALKISGTKVLGYIGSISKDKGLDIFIDVSEYLLERNPLLRFLWVGNGPFLDAAKKRVKELGIEKYYIFIPFSKDVRQYLSVMDVFFFPTRHNEGLSIALLEAASMEKIIIAHDIGGNKELVINEETGYIYSKKSDEELAKLVLTVLEKKQENMSIMKAARAKVENRFNMEHMAIQYQSAFSKLCEN